MFQPPPRMSKLPSATLAASASSIVTLSRSIADPARSPAARGPFVARRRRVRSALGHSARSASRRRRPRHGCGAPRRLGRRRASGAPHPASSPCESTPTRSARTCMSGLGAPARRCPTTSGPLRRAVAVIHGAPSYRISGSGWAVEVRRRARPASWAVDGSGDRRIRGVGLPSPGSVLQMGGGASFPGRAD
jgi:hypothetical protein